MSALQGHSRAAIWPCLSAVYDWSGNLSKQTIGYQFTNKNVDIQSKNKDTNGLLVEGGLDYTIAKINSSSYKVYLRGGIEAWGGERGTDYRTSGGFEWQF